jgi:hypothetical protein
VTSFLSRVLDAFGHDNPLPACIVQSSFKDACVMIVS